MSGVVSTSAVYCLERLVFKTTCYVFSRTFSFSLHWLRNPERIIFKVATLTFRAVHGIAPHYITSLFTCVADMPNR